MSVDASSPSGSDAIATPLARDRSIVAVCGFGRCGSSMTMQMLHAGGVPVVGEFPAFEDEHVSCIPIDLLWLECQRGKALKILDPQRVLKRAPPLRVIWLDRDAKEQARSTIKFMSAMSGGTMQFARDSVRRLAASYSQDRRAAMALFARLQASVLVLRFEDVLSDPVAVAAKMSSIVGPFNERAAAAAVLRRPASCAPDMSIEQSFIERSEIADAPVERGVNS